MIFSETLSWYMSVNRWSDKKKFDYYVWFGVVVKLMDVLKIVSHVGMREFHSIIFCIPQQLATLLLPHNPV